MELKYHGVNCIEIKTKKAKIMVDPYDDSYGLGELKNKADITLFSGTEPNAQEEGNGFVIDMPGEYEVSGVSIWGIPARSHLDKPEDPRNSVIFKVSYKGVNIVIIGNAQPKLEDDQIEDIDGVHAAVLPVGGNGLTLDAQAAAEMINVIDTQIVIPTHYDDGKTKYQSSQAGLDNFEHEMGIKPKKVDSLKINSGDLPEETLIYQLKIK